MHIYIQYMHTDTQTHHGVVGEVPIDARHSHEHRNVALQRLIVFLETLLDRLVVPRNPCVLCVRVRVCVCVLAL